MQKLHDLFLEQGCYIQNPAERARFQSITRRVGDLRRQGIKSLNADTTGVWSQEADLNGLPEDVLNRCRRLGADATTSNNGEDEKDETSHPQAFTEVRYWLSVKDPDLNAVRKHVTNPRTRRLLGSAAYNRCPQNMSIYREVFTLRDEAARILGFENHAGFRMKYKMLGDVRIVDSFLSQVSKELRHPRDADLKRRREMKLQDVDAQANGEANRSLNLSDTWYYDRLIKERTFSYKQKEVAEYFPLERTLRKLLDIFEHLFGIKFFQIDPEEHWTWHPSVMMFVLWDRDKSQDFLGYLYLDLFPRDGKYTHAGHYGLVPVRMLVRFVFVY